MLTSIDEIRDDISVLTSDDGSWPDMPVLDSDSCPSIKSVGELEELPAGSVVNESYHYTLLPDDSHGRMPLSLQCLLTPPTPDTYEDPSQSVYHLPLPTSDHNFDAESQEEMRLPSVPTYQPKWIHRKLWARDEKEGECRRNSFLSNLKRRSWGWTSEKRPSSPECTEKSGVEKVVSIQAPLQPVGLERSPSVSTSIASGVSFATSSHTTSSKHLKPTKSILSSRDSLALKKHGRARSGSESAPSVKSVKFTEAPTVYYDTEYAYEYAVDEEEEEEEYRPCSPAPSSTTPCFSNSSNPGAASKRPTNTRTSIRLREAFSRLLPSSRRPYERPSISGPYPLWKDADGASIRSGRSISSVRSAPVSRARVKELWGRITIACTM